MPLTSSPPVSAPSAELSRNEEPQECEEASIDAMTDRHTPSDDHEKRRLDPTGDACVDLPVGAVDLLDASPVECRSNGDHGEASLGRHLGREHEVSAFQPPQTKRRRLIHARPKVNAVSGSAGRSTSCLMRSAAIYRFRRRILQNQPQGQG